MALCRLYPVLETAQPRAAKELLCALLRLEVQEHSVFSSIVLTWARATSRLGDELVDEADAEESESLLLRILFGEALEKQELQSPSNEEDDVLCSTMAVFASKRIDELLALDAPWFMNGIKMVYQATQNPSQLQLFFLEALVDVQPDVQVLSRLLLRNGHHALASSLCLSQVSLSPSLKTLSVAISTLLNASNLAE